MRLAYRQLFQPAAPVKKAASQFVENIGSVLHNGTRHYSNCTVCFHVRTGEKVGAPVPVDFTRNHNFAEFGRCGQMVEDYHFKRKSCKAHPIWLVLSDLEDNKRLVESLSVYSPHARIETTSSLGPMIHIDRFHPDQRRDRAALDAALLRSFTDFVLLQHCQYLVHSTSMFSLLASVTGASSQSVMRYSVPLQAGCSMTAVDQDLYPEDEAAAFF